MATTKKAKRVKAIELKVGQRWQYGESADYFDDVITRINRDVVETVQPNGGCPMKWSLAEFRGFHRSLRDDRAESSEPPKPTTTETMTYYGEVTELQAYRVVTPHVVRVTVDLGPDRLVPFMVHVPPEDAPCLGDVCKVTFSKPVPA